LRARPRSQAHIARSHAAVKQASERRRGAGLTHQRERSAGAHYAHVQRPREKDRNFREHLLTSITFLNQASSIHDPPVKKPDAN
jgi:hypothetical protein